MHKRVQELGFFFVNLDRILAHIPSHCSKCSVRVPLEKVTPTGKFIVKQPNQVFVADTTEFTSTKFPQFYNVVLSDIVDAFSKMASSYIVSGKSADETHRVFRDLMAIRRHIPKLIRTDNGTEYVNKRVKDLLTNFAK